jgi:hypothetical protein
LKEAGKNCRSRACISSGMCPGHLHNKIGQKIYDEMKKKNPHWSREDKELRKKVSS